MGEAIPVGAETVRLGETELRTMARRFAGLLRHVALGNTPVPGMRWTVGEIGAHVVQSAINALEVVDGRASAYQGVGFDPATDEKLVAALPERDPGRLADLVESSYASLIEAMLDVPEDTELPVAATFTPPSLRAVLALDFMLHGGQIAEAAGRTFEVPPEMMRTCVALVLPALADPVAARGLTATFSMRFRGASPLLLGWQDGRLWVENGGPGRAADCVISADPRAFLLQGIGLYPQWKLALTGRVVSWGRRPWLALRLSSLVPAVPHGGLAA